LAKIIKFSSENSYFYVYSRQSEVIKQLPDTC